MSNINPSDASSKKVAAGICAILLGALGIHKFILGYTTEGLIMLLVTILTFGFGGAIMGIVGLVEGIITVWRKYAYHFLRLQTEMFSRLIIVGSLTPSCIIYLTKTDEEFLNTYIVEKKGWF